MAAVIVRGKRERWKAKPTPCFCGARDYVLYGSPQRRYRIGTPQQRLYMRGYLHALSFHYGEYPELRLSDGILEPWFEQPGANKGGQKQ